METTSTYYHLGSWTTITDEDGNIEQELSFDAWGNFRNPYTWTGANTTRPMFDRGFTGHEHLYDFGLINMNGRMYDPVMSGFLSVDNYVQSPDNSQNFNRYAYCLNNPLKYTDPDGEFLTWSIGTGGFSVGLNFTPAGVPLGFGINVGWANGGSVGLYGECAYRVGGTGLGVGGGYQASLDYHFATQSSTITLTRFGFASYGCFSAGGSESISYDLAGGTRSYCWGINAGVGYGGKIGDCGRMLGGVFSVSYGSNGWNYGLGGYFRGLSLQDKLNIRITDYRQDLIDAGLYTDDPITVGNARNLRDETNLESAGSLLYYIDDEGKEHYARGAAVANYRRTKDGNYYTDRRIYLSKSAVRSLWRCETMGEDVLYEELFHNNDHRDNIYVAIQEAGMYDYRNNIMEFRANMYNYERTGNQMFLIKAAAQLTPSFIDFMLNR